MKKIPLALILCILVCLKIEAETGLAGEESKILIEQEFQTINITDDSVEGNDEKSNGKFAFLNQSSGGTKEISIKNEFHESVKIILVNESGSDDDIELYLNAYENKDSVIIPKNIKYKVKVYNLYNEYLGFIYKANTLSNNKISISPFFLISDNKQETMKPTKEASPSANLTENNSNPEPKEIKTETKEVLNPLPVENSTEEKPRSIKIANISESDIHIDLIDPSGNQIGGGWTISNDIYVPQFLKYKSEPINVLPDVKLLINNIKSNEIITKYAKDLNIDEKGHYVWFVD